MNKIDKLDKQITRLLRDTPDISTRDMALALEVSDKTILNRLSALSEHNHLRVTLQWDMHSLGLDIAGHVFIHTGSRPIAEVARQIAGIEEVQSVSEVVGPATLYVFIAVTSLPRFYEIVHGIPALIPGTSITECTIAADTIKYRPDYGAGAALDTSWPHFEQIRPRFKVDEFDFTMVKLLQQDARVPNREIARRLDVSEAMIRQRIKKLIKQGAIHRSVIVNPFTYDYGSAALVRLQIRGGEIEKFCNRVHAHDNVAAIMKIIGSYNLLLIVLGKNLEAVTDEVFGYIYNYDCIERHSILPLLRIHKYRYTLVSYPSVHPAK